MKRSALSAVAVVAFSVALIVAAPGALADVRLPAAIDSNMVIQQETPVCVWGWADAGEKVTVTLGEKSAAATADPNGAWKVALPALKADGKARTMTVAGKNTIQLDNILVGEVWIGSGQSNMEWTLAKSKGGAEAVAAADCPQIRLLHVKKVQSPAPAPDIQPTARWNICTPETVTKFSAVLYFFGRRLHGELKVPVGLINSSWGGSPIEPWTVTDNGSGGMYNAMIAPLTPFAIRGATWYQGETNAMNKNGLAYAGKMKDLIEGWRKVWGQPDMPFYYVQIAPWSGAKYLEGELPALWEAQAATLKLPHTGMAVVTDLVDKISDIHPTDKQPVGDRLALWALAKDYGRKDLVYSGPLYKSMKVEGDKVCLTFAHVGGGLRSRDGKALTEFEIAGADGKFIPAEAKIDGQTVVVSASGVTAPQAVRFGWTKTANPNLINAAGLPASPFQTDNWTGGTGE